MRIGIPSEIKTLEGRVALIPAAAAELVRAGHDLFIQSGAGVASGYPDADYLRIGARIQPDAQSLFAASQMIIKVKEPQPEEWPMLRPDHLLFCYLHLAAEPALLEALRRIGLTAVAFETVEEPGRRLPLLAPMSDIAGRIAVQAGANLLHRPHGGKGLLLGGLPAAERGEVVVLGAGAAGGNAASLAAAMGARVTVFDHDRERLAAMRSLGANVTGLYPFQDAIDQAALRADLLIGAVLVTGARAPHLVSAEVVRRMTPGSVIVDISVDQGGCVETTRPTTWAAPTYLAEGVVHFAVTNMPGAVPRTASQAISAALIPYALCLAAPDWEQHPALAKGINVRAGEVIHPALRSLS
jgi:alanine dehydrogenase